VESANGTRLRPWTLLCMFLRRCLRWLAFGCFRSRICVALLRLSGVRIGKGAFINQGVWFIDRLDGAGYIQVGENVAIAPGACLVAASHPNRSCLRDLYECDIYKPVVLENDCWVGAHAVILPGVRVGQRAVVGAGSVVTCDVPDDTVVVGVPAREIGKVWERFPRKGGGPGAAPPEPPAGSGA